MILNMEVFLPFSKLPFNFHVFFGLFVRLAVIYYNDFHDRIPNASASFTDIDYVVISDAARHISNGHSPYKRDTYKWSPIIAFLALPNTIYGKDAGKIIFSIIDIIITVSVKRIIELQLKSDKRIQNPEVIPVVSQRSALLWLYNPIHVGISSRGNAFSIPTFFIILSLLFLQRGFGRGLYKYALSGIFLGIATNIYIYPIFFLFPMYLSLGVYRGRFYDYLPNRKQIIFVFSCLITVCYLLGLFYHLYGYDYLEITVLKPITCRYIKPSFSILFFYTYIAEDQLPYDYVRMLTFTCQTLSILVIAKTFARDPKTLNFALFCITTVMVLYNNIVMTQHYVWYISLIPLFVHNLEISSNKFSYVIMMWCLGQGVWMLCAYDIEFKGHPGFIMIWWKSIFMFCGNHFILCYFINHFVPGYGYGKLIRETTNAPT